MHSNLRLGVQLGNRRLSFFGNEQGLGCTKGKGSNIPLGVQMLRNRRLSSRFRMLRFGMSKVGFDQILNRVRGGVKVRAPTHPNRRLVCGVKVRLLAVPNNTTKTKCGLLVEKHAASSTKK